MKNTIPSAELIGAFGCTLLHSENKFITYPASGRIQPIEVGLGGQLINAAFQSGEFRHGEFFAEGGPVCVKRPVFWHSSF